MLAAPVGALLRRPDVDVPVGLRGLHAGWHSRGGLGVMLELMFVIVVAAGKVALLVGDVRGQRRDGAQHRSAEHEAEFVLGRHRDGANARAAAKVGSAPPACR